jgi:hypothetical protein
MRSGKCLEAPTVEMRSLNNLAPRNRRCLFLSIAGPTLDVGAETPNDAAEWITKMNGPERQEKLVRTEEINRSCDIKVRARTERIVMIIANAAGRKSVDDLFPDVQWTTDEVFRLANSPDWLFTHIRVTKLPPHFETVTPLAFASPDAIGMAVAIALQRLAKPERVIHSIGSGEMRIYRGAALSDQSLARELFAEYIPPATAVAGHAHVVL